MSGRIQGKLACITGAASGIGRATAQLFAREGASVIVTDVRADLGASVVAQIIEAGGKARFAALDVSDESAWIDLMAQIRADYGRLDILVNNAGIGLSGPVTEISLEAWRRLSAINVEGTFLGTKHALPLMREGGGGGIVNVSSIAGIRPSANASAYAASKGAIRLFTKAVALECAAAKDGVRVNSIHPGIVETAIWDDLIRTSSGSPDEHSRAAMLEKIAASIPLGRAGHVDEIAAGILWLASDESRYMTGAELVLDGGRTIG